MRIQFRLFASIVSLAGLLLVVCFPQTSSAQTIVLEFYDDETGEPVSARFQWAPKTRKATKPRILLSHGAWWLATPDFSITPKMGDYEFLVQRGPEFTNIRGGFTMERKSRDVVAVEIPRMTYMRSERWYSADHSVQLPQAQAERWQRADAVDVISLPQTLASSAAVSSPAVSSVAPKSKLDPEPTPDRSSSKGPPVYEKLIETHNPNIVGEQLRAFHSTHNLKHGRFRIHRLRLQESHPQESSPQEAEDSRSGGSVSGDGTSQSSDAPELQVAPETFTDAMRLVTEMEAGSDAWIELIDPWARDVPILLSTGKVNGVQILSSTTRPASDETMTIRSSQDRVPYPFAKIQRTFLTSKSTQFVFAPYGANDRILFKGPQGAARLGELCYWTMLETGMRLTATAGTDFGEADTHLGYNRNYFYSPVPPDIRVWADAVRNGEVVVTNGPLLRPLLNNYPPGATFQGNATDGVELDFAVSLTVRERVDYLDVIFNGETIYSAKLEDHYKNGEFPPLKITQSGWLVTRVVTQHDKGYRLATTSPFYFQLDATPRISRRAVEFMIAWLDNSEADIRAKNQWKDYEPWVVEAKAYWKQRLEQANAP